MCFFYKVGGALNILKAGSYNIEKKDRNRRFIKNWRPIFLLNVDLKTASKTLACKLKKVVGKIIEPDQTAYIKCRHIHKSTRLIQDMLDYIENSSE